jgi:hypothetical protein
METTMRKLLTFLKTQNPRREGQGLAGGWLEARVWTRCQAKDPLDASAVTSFVQARFLSIVRVLCTTLALGALAFGVCSPAAAQGQSILGFPPGVFQNRAAIDAPAGGGGCSQATTFLARTSGLSGTETAAYTTMICGMVSDGTWSLLDALYIFATNNTTTANLNLVSTNFGITQVGTVTFAADTGYTGDGSTGVLNTGFIPASSGINYVQNSASIGVYVLNNRTGSSGNDIEIGSNNGNGSGSVIGNVLSFPIYAVNDGGNGYSISTTRGSFIATRLTSSTSSIYLNGNTTPLASGSIPSVAPLGPAPVAILGSSISTSPSFSGFSIDQVAAAFLGAGLTATQQQQVSNRINAYMAAMPTPINVY